jgi:isocitrate dehydrogenase
MKIQMKTPLVEIDGDEMTRVIWAMIKERLLEPFVDLKLERYDLSLEERDRTDDKVTFDAAQAIEKHGVGVKCATITPDAASVKLFNLKQAWPSPNGSIRAYLDGTVFRKAIMVKNVPPGVRSWKKPITIGRHAYGDIFRNGEMLLPGPGKLALTYTPGDGSPAQTIDLGDVEEPTLVSAHQNLESSIKSFARACINVALSDGTDLWFGCKDTISKTYHGRFRELFSAEVEARKADFEQAGLNYETGLLIDDAIARSVRHEGGFLWACMNYEGDLMSDMVGSGFGSLGMMTSVLVSPNGQFEFEAAHGTVTRHYKRHLAGEKTSTNPGATLFAWTGGLAKRGELDDIPELVNFAQAIETSMIETIESGSATGDLVGAAVPPIEKATNLDDFITAIEDRLVKKVAAGLR